MELAHWKERKGGPYVGGGGGGGGRSCKVRGAYGVSIDWDAVGSRVAFAVGNGRRVRFWLDM